MQTDPIRKTSKVLRYEYEGEYKDDKKQGHGVFKWPSGSVYQGGFKNEFRHGFGIMIWMDGTVYEGLWKKGVQQG